jgi:hypothetical protein
MIHAWDKDDGPLKDRIGIGNVVDFCEFLKVRMIGASNTPKRFASFDRVVDASGFLRFYDDRRSAGEQKKAR